MKSMQPYPITEEEWKEIFEFDRKEGVGFGCDTMEDVEELKSMCYGCRYDFVSGCPGYCGDVFVLMGDALAAAPILLTRHYETKELELCRFN